MAKNPKRQQKIRAQKNARRQVKKKNLQPRGIGLSRPGAWPLFDCRITSNWRDTKEITTIVVVRKTSSDEVALGCFLVDLGCLGIKNAMTKRFPSEDEYEDFSAHLAQGQSLKNCDLDLAAKVIDEAVRYARSLGFAPHRDSRKALELLGTADPRNCAEPVPLGGEDGKPFYFAGPHDNVKRIISTLEKNLGPDNFHYFAPVDGSFPADEL